MTFPPLPISILCVKIQREHQQTHLYISQENSSATEAMRKIPTLNNEATLGRFEMILNSQYWVPGSSQQRERESQQGCTCWTWGTSLHPLQHPIFLPLLTLWDSLGTRRLCTMSSSPHSPSSHISVTCKSKQALSNPGKPSGTPNTTPLETPAHKGGPFTHTKGLRAHLRCKYRVTPQHLADPRDPNKGIVITQPEIPNKSLW